MNNYQLESTVNPGSPRFVVSDEFEGQEQLCNRAEIAEKYIRGEGIEVGALHKPLAINKTSATVRYVDYKTLEENRKRYPELVNEPIVQTDIIDDGFILSAVEDNSIDFIIANHALEHSPDPFGTLEIWLSRLKKKGIIYVTVPIAEKCYDQGRPITSLEHLATDHHDFVTLNKAAVLRTTESHLEEFITISGANIRKMNNLEPSDPLLDRQLRSDLMRDLETALKTADTYSDMMSAHINRINRVYDIHYHTFSPSSYENFITRFCLVNNAVTQLIAKNGNGECIAVIRK